MSLPLAVGRQTVRLRRLLARHPSLRWIAIAVTCGGFSISTWSHRSDVAEARQAWGSSSPVWIAEADTAPGQPLAARSIDVPDAVAPAEAVGPDPTGATARQHVGAGEIITETDVAGRSGRLAIVPDGWLVVAVAERIPSGAEVGERVLVVADGSVIADEALVVAVAESVASVAVPAGVGPLVALADESGVRLLRSP
jgi:hypothetical protein